MNSKDKLKKARKAIKQSGWKKNRLFLNLTCKKCKRIYHIRVNDKAIYTDKIIKKWRCLLCR